MSVTGTILMNDTKLEQNLDKIGSCIKIASDHDGKVFGEYVRDVIIPRLKDPFCNISFTTIKFWFKTKNDAISAILKMKKSYVLTNTPGSTNFERYLMDNIYFEIIVSDNFPVNDDNDVDYLTYDWCNYSDYDLGRFGKFESQHKSYDYKTLIDLIHRKEMTLLSLREIDAISVGMGSNELIGTTVISRNSDYVKRMNDYISKGWTIRYNGDVIGKFIVKIINPDTAISSKPTISDLKKKAFQSMIEINKDAKSILTKRYDALVECNVHYKLIDVDFMSYLKMNLDSVGFVADNMISYIQNFK